MQAASTACEGIGVIMLPRNLGTATLIPAFGPKLSQCWSAIGSVGIAYPKLQQLEVLMTEYDSYQHKILHFPRSNAFLGLRLDLMFAA